MIQLLRNKTNKQKSQSSSFNSGNTLNRDQQCSGLILEGNILHVSQVRGCSACNAVLLQCWWGHCSSTRPSSELLSDFLCQIFNHYFQYNFAFTRIQLGYFEVQLMLEPGLLLYLTYKSRKKVGFNLLIFQLHRFCFKEAMFK